ncbi:8829_t:CDS:2 [Funneliformis geosporum]|uniref:14638_t:CDS:1 n=1 Tax=Funneliformis geosporum TaxID=1117311 RepID=A0A9W4WND2_9GLOM|nr:8829_t:CDS:2 [Funneliformis geosporum]CAI2174459.1 14638_t:CDS:2 [Funneliformis geosporum]
MTFRKLKEIIFIGTGTSSGVPTVACLTDPQKSCKTCMSTLTSEGEVNVRRNTSLLVRVNHEDGRVRNIVIDCGKTFYVSALKWWPYHELRNLDALILTHPHADAINGLDDLRAWTLHNVIQESIPVYLTSSTFESVQNLFPYLVDSKQASGGGDLPSFQWNMIDINHSFNVEGLEFTPLPDEPYIYVGYRFENISYISDCNFIPDDTLIKMQGSDIMILDALDYKEHPSHFSIYQAINISRNSNPVPKRTYLVGFSHSVNHSELVKEMEKLQLNEPLLWVRPAHDGLKVVVDNINEEQ